MASDYILSFVGFIHLNMIDCKVISLVNKDGPAINICLHITLCYIELGSHLVTLFLDHIHCHLPLPTLLMLHEWLNNKKYIMLGNLCKGLP